MKQFQKIPGVGPSVAGDLYLLGFRSVEDLRHCDPQEMYHRLCSYMGTKVDRCMLYVFRCAVYYASHDDHNPFLLKWWNWKDKK